MAVAEPLLTVPELAERLRLSPDTVRSLARAGRFPYLRPSSPAGKMLFCWADVLAAIQGSPLPDDDEEESKVSDR